MSVLFGHPSGSPFSHNAALAHYEANHLEAFCVPWMPTPAELRSLRLVPGLKKFVDRLERRSFPPLSDAPRIEGRLGEWSRLLRRRVLNGWISTEQLAYEANDWLMRTMKRECSRSSVTAIHSYEDCSWWQFQEAKRLDKACIYDMPIGYYPAWEETQNELSRRYSDALPSSGLPSSRYVRPEQKKREMELADVVLAPSSFVKKTIDKFIEKKIAIAPYGVDAEFWRPADDIRDRKGPVQFVYAGQCSVRKGIPLLLEAWKAAGLKGAELKLIGSWHLAERVKRELPNRVTHIGPIGRHELREFYRRSDVFVFPSFFEGFGLVILEAMSCGLPAIATDGTAAPDFIDDGCGKVIPSGDVDALIEALRTFFKERDDLPALSSVVRSKARECSWEKYRRAVSGAVTQWVT
jgi:starch synthase